MLCPRTCRTPTTQSVLSSTGGRGLLAWPGPAQPNCVELETTRPKAKIAAPRADGSHPAPSVRSGPLTALSSHLTHTKKPRNFVEIRNRATILVPCVIVSPSICCCCCWLPGAILLERNASPSLPFDCTSPPPPTQTHHHQFVRPPVSPARTGHDQTLGAAAPGAPRLRLASPPRRRPLRGGIRARVCCFPRFCSFVRSR